MILSRKQVIFRSARGNPHRYQPPHPLFCVYRCSTAPDLLPLQALVPGFSVLPAPGFSPVQALLPVFVQPVMEKAAPANRLAIPSPARIFFRFFESIEASHGIYGLIIEGSSPRNEKPGGSEMSCDDESFIESEGIRRDEHKSKK